jgi:phage shock protein PspC (stress-responsive transcriptional regulator)
MRIRVLWSDIIIFGGAWVALLIAYIVSYKKGW